MTKLFNKTFTKALKNEAWDRLQVAITTAIAIRGEYDVTCLVDDVAQNMKYQHLVDYTKIADYLEGRYATEEDCA
jgi:hypothetical protein